MRGCVRSATTISNVGAILYGSFELDILCHSLIEGDLSEKRRISTIKCIGIDSQTGVAKKTYIRVVHQVVLVFVLGRCK